MSGRRRAKSTIRVWQAVVEAGQGTITELRTVRDDPGCVWLVIDGERAGILDRASVSDARLVMGLTLDAERIGLIDTEIRSRLCERSAVRSLAMRNQSRVGLIRGLRRKGFDAPTAEAVAEKYAEAGAIDDARFAETQVRNELARRPAGRRLLEAKLRAKGIADGDARPAIDAALADRDEYEDALGMARRTVASIGRGVGRAPEPDVIRRRVVGRLARRGFSGDAVRRAVDAAMRDDPE